MADAVVMAARDNAYETEGLPVDADGYKDSSKEFRQIVKAGIEMICDSMQSERGCRDYSDIIGSKKPLSSETAKAVLLAALKMA